MSTKEQTLSLALNLRNLGYIPEFGYADGKKPLRKGWATNPLDTLEALLTAFTQSDPVTVGINCHPDRANTPLVVVDNDSPQATDAHEQRITAGEWPPTPFTVNTPSGGTHYYYQQNPNTPTWKNSANTETKLDYRAYHGFIVAPGSTRKDGGTYTLTGIIPPATELPYAPTPPPQNRQKNTPGNTAPIPTDIDDIRERWQYDGNNYLCKAHQDAHGSLSIRWMEDGAWALKCFSGCTTQAILESVHLTNQDLKPYAKPFTNTPTNECERLVLQDTEGNVLRLPCDSKRCDICGPIKRKLMQQQLLDTFTELAYITTYKTAEQVSTVIERERKAAQRAGDTFPYQSVGDDYLGYILVTATPINQGQRKTSLKEWMKRIIHNWLYGDSRIRRSRLLGGLSRLTYTRNAHVGTSIWARVVKRVETVRELLLKREMERRDALVDEVGWQVWDEGGKIESTISAWGLTDE